MQITDLLQLPQIEMHSAAADLPAAVHTLCGLLAQGDAVQDAALLEQDVLARLAQGCICMGNGLAVPHAKTAAVRRAALAAITLDKPIHCPTPDGEPVDLLFLIAAPEGENDLHIRVLSALAGLLVDKAFCRTLAAAQTPEQFRACIAEKENAEPPQPQPQKGRHIRLLAVTACPNGLAHTYMAAEALQKSADKYGIAIKIETNGAGGVENELTPADIAEADGIIVAVNRAVPTARFVGKKVVNASADEAIREPEKLLEKVLSGKAEVYRGGEAMRSHNHTELANEVYRHLMYGVSRFIPFVVAGGISMALAMLVTHLNGPATLAVMLNTVGQAAMTMIYPVLAAFIAASIGDTPAFMPGLMGGYLAQMGTTVHSESGWISSGFGGALIAGFAAGALLRVLTTRCPKLPKDLDHIRTGLLVPLGSLLGIGALMVFLVNPVLGQVNHWLDTTLNSMRGGSRLLLGCVLGGLMATDYGGPINKAAYVTGTLALVSGQQDVMAAVMAGGMVPPLGVALACLLFPEKFTQEERRTVPQNLVMGASFVTEGALPFALKDPFRVVPACMAGSALAGYLAVLVNCACPAPHGGVFLLAVMGNPAGFVMANASGALLTALILGLTKRDIPQG